MRITLIALGSRGDVQPFIALGRGMVERGHTVRVVATDDYGDLVRSYDLAFASAGGSISTLMNPDVVHEALDGAANPIKLGRRFLREVGPLVQRIMEACTQASHDADFLVASTLGVFVAAHIAEALQMPFVPCHMHPYAPTRVYPSVFFPTLPRSVPFRGSYNRLSHWLTEQGYWQLLRTSLNHARSVVLGLPRWSPRDALHASSRQNRAVLYGYSALIAPRPFDWDANQHITGYWPLQWPPQWTPPLELMHFLRSGPPPVYISSGSMLTGRDPAGFTAMIMRAVELTGRRAILHAGWNDWAHGVMPPTILKVQSVPHSWLFNHVAAVVTHGGAGTTAAALHAGVGLVVVPFLGDQRFWGERVQALGLAPAPLARAHLTSELLAERIEDALDTRRSPTRGAIAAALQAEHGVARALNVLALP
jgi:sterol 3beta-glucosyltransferase